MWGCDVQVAERSTTELNVSNAILYRQQTVRGGNQSEWNLMSNVKLLKNGCEVVKMSLVVGF